MKIRVLNFILAVVMIFTLIPAAAITVSAADKVPQPTNARFAVQNGEFLVMQWDIPENPDIMGFKLEVSCGGEQYSSEWNGTFDKSRTISAPFFVLRNGGEYTFKIKSTASPESGKSDSDYAVSPALKAAKSNDLIALQFVSLRIVKEGETYIDFTAPANQPFPAGYYAFGNIYGEYGSAKFYEGGTLMSSERIWSSITDEYLKDKYLIYFYDLKPNDNNITSIKFATSRDIKYGAAATGDSLPSSPALVDKKTPAETPPAEAPQAVTALYSPQKVFVNGKETAFDVYSINGNNYFKLRDLAYILIGTEKQFEVGYDGAKNAISLTSGKPYTAVGGEMETKGSGNKSATPTKSTIYLDGKEVNFAAYYIDGNNYFKLRDIGQTFNFGTDYDRAKNAVVIDTGKSYTPEGGTPATTNDKSTDGKPAEDMKKNTAGTDMSKLMSDEQCYEFMLSLTDDPDLSKGNPYGWCIYSIPVGNGKWVWVTIVYNFEYNETYLNNKYAFWILPQNYSGNGAPKEEDIIYVEAVIIDGKKYVSVDAVWAALAKVGVKKT